jgi:hypothetical protein
MTNESASEEIASPCIGVCRLDAAGVCVGCLRTGPEIGRWRDANGTERREILRAADQRRAGRPAALALPAGDPVPRLQPAGE